MTFDEWWEEESKDYVLIPAAETAKEWARMAWNAALSTRPEVAASKVRFAYVPSVTEEQRNHAWKSGIAAIGDARLAWVNEGDIITHGEEIKGRGYERPPLASPQPQNGKGTE